MSIPARKSLVLSFYFFTIIAAFWIQKPIRTSRFITAMGSEYLPLVRFVTAAALFPIAAAFAVAARRFRRRSLLSLINLVFFLSSLLFGYAFFSVGMHPPWLAFTFFSYVDVFNTLLVASFWSVANDVLSSKDVRKYFGYIGTGGILGGVFGSAVTGWTIGRLGPAFLLFFCAGLVALALFLSRALPNGEVQPAEGRSDDNSFQSPFEGMRLIFQSPYLLSIAGIVLFYELVSVIIDYQFNSAAAKLFNGEMPLASFLGKFSSGTIALAGAFQFFGTTAVLRRWGPRVGLLILPLCLLSGTAFYLLFPSFWVLAFLFGSDAVFHYSVNQSSKEALYSLTSARVKYEAKAFIDMFFFRLAKGAAAGVLLLSNFLFMPGGAAFLSWINLGSLGFWIWSARYAGLKFSQHEWKAIRVAGKKTFPAAAE